MTPQKINPMVYPGLTDYGRKVFKYRIMKSTENTPDGVINNVCELFRIHKSDLISKSRKRKLVMARTIAMYDICYSFNRITLENIGKMFNRDHTTVIYCREQYEDLLKYNSEFKDMVSDYKQFVK